MTLVLRDVKYALFVKLNIRAGSVRPCDAEILGVLKNINLSLSDFIQKVFSRRISVGEPGLR